MVSSAAWSSLASKGTSFPPASRVLGLCSTRGFARQGESEHKELAVAAVP